MTVAAWRDAEPDQFAAAVLNAAERLGVLPLAVEKDYWVCRALGAITHAFPRRIIFKGGTSLEKLRVIRRFSEDLDLLVVGSYPSNRAAQRGLKEIIDVASAVTGAPAAGAGSGGGPGAYHRSAYLAPPLQHSSEGAGVADAAAILVELGQSGGPNPHAARVIESLLSRELGAAGFDIAAWSDLAPFRADILHPGRTLIEKLLRINNFTSDAAARQTAHGWVRIGRQFYDVWALLGTPEVLDFLADKASAASVLTDCYRASRAFKPDMPVPDGGLARSVAFVTEGPLAAELRTRHDQAMAGLYYGTDRPPSFDDVIHRVAANKLLLDIS